MKKLLFILFVTATVHADGVGLPSNVCYEFCGDKQQEIWRRFESGGVPEFKDKRRVFSGVCHVLGDNINADREHHVGFLVNDKTCNCGLVFLPKCSRMMR